MTEAELQISLMTQQQPAQPATSTASPCASTSISISGNSTLSVDLPNGRGGGGGERDVAGGALTRARERVAECLCELCEVTAAGL